MMEIDPGHQSPLPQRKIFQQLDRTEVYPYTLREYGKRILWNLVRLTVFRYSLPRAFRWRRWLLRLFGAKLTNTSYVRGGTWIWHPWLFQMGHYSTLADGVIIYNLGPVSIQDHSFLSQDVYVCAGTHDYTVGNMPLMRPPIRIGSGVWVAAQAFIGPSVTIGDNCVVAARSVVVKDVPAGWIVGGNPAKQIKPRVMRESIARPRVQSDRPLRILHLLDGSHAGGISRYLLDLGTAMREKGHEVFFAGARGAWHDKFEKAGLNWITVRANGGPLGLYFAARHLRKLFADKPPDVLHAHYRRSTWIGHLLRRGRQPPLLYTLHLSHIPLGFGQRWFRDYIDRVHVASVQARDWLLEERLAVEANISYIPHGIDPSRFPVATDGDRLAARQRLGLPVDATVVAYVGRLDVPKNEDWLLDVLQRCDARLLVAGTGPHESSFRSLIAARRLDDRVTLLGEMDCPLEVYQAADAVLLPSTREGFSYANAEAMSVGRPMLRTKTSGAVDLIEQDVTGIYVPIERQAFVDAAVNFLADKNRLRAMGAAAAARAREKFTFDKQLEETIELYQFMAASKR